MKQIKYILALMLVIALALASLTSCDINATIDSVKDKINGILGNDTDDPAVEDSRKGRSYLAGGTNSILHEDKRLAMQRSRNERRIPTAILKELAGRVHEIAVMVHRKDFARTIIGTGESADERALTRVPLTDEHEARHIRSGSFQRKRNAGLRRNT